MPLKIYPTGATEMTIAHIERFSQKFTIDGCWQWQGYKSLRGYGQYRLFGKSKFAHRIMYELVNGGSDLTLHIDHLCRNRSCVNPKHLELVTPKTNVLRGNTIPRANMDKKFCKQGHPLSGENLMVLPHTGNNHSVERRCRACQNGHNRRYALRKKLALRKQQEDK